ncbi:MAG: biopolymer transporter ExbB [Alteromonadaceae bacterium]|nr:MAG: biopolymer transporter ExbB [Alteromonadaceae bacterium]
MDKLIDALWLNLQNFLSQGGVILVVIMITTFFLWLLIVERVMYFYRDQKNTCQRVVNQWDERGDKRSWFADKTRLRLLSVARIEANNNLNIIKLVVIIAPLLGLLGTVTGMIDVFDVMASTGSSSARGMAGGVSKATIPTMAGMVVSLTGLLFSVSLQRKANTSIEHLSNQLTKENVA